MTRTMPTQTGISFWIAWLVALRSIPQFQPGAPPSNSGNPPGATSGAS